MPKTQGKQIGLDTATFDNALSSADDDVQTALETLDDKTSAGGKTALTTTDATLTDAVTIALADGEAVLIEAHIAGRETSGVAPFDMAGYVRRAVVVRRGAAAAVWQRGQRRGLLLLDR